MTSTPSTPPTDALPPRRAAGDRARMLLRRVALFLGIAALVLAFDQWTKALVRDRLAYGETWPEGWTLIRLTFVENTGAAFGIFQGASSILMVVALVAVAGITFVLITLPSRHPGYIVALSAILGGATGNLVDRFRHGAVTDFIDPAYYPAFNVADSAIVCGVLALLALTWFERSDVEPAAHDPSEAAR